MNEEETTADKVARLTRELTEALGQPDLDVDGYRVRALLDARRAANSLLLWDEMLERDAARRAIEPKLDQASLRANETAALANEDVVRHRRAHESLLAALVAVEDRKAAAFERIAAALERKP